MKLNVEENYRKLSHQAAIDLLSFIDKIPDPLICMASGDSPKGLYKNLFSIVDHESIDISGWNFLSLDEWLGMNGKDEGSCRFHLDRDFFELLGIAPNQITFFDGRAADPALECERVEKFITAKNGIDVTILGLGLNGHVGMNEPGTSINSRSHVAEIHPVTKDIGQKYFMEPKDLSGGLTLGIQTILESRLIMLLVSGDKKAGIVKEVLTDPISNERPASLLRNHPNLYVYLDEDAALKL